jgi:DNA polymerase III delta prime subunit
MEDQWIKRQADYVKFLWEAYQTGRPSARDANAVWKQAYDSLKGEFMQFRDLHDKAEDMVKMHERDHNAERARELLDRISSGEQTLPEDQMKMLLEILQAKVAGQKMAKTAKIQAKLLRENDMDADEKEE